MKSSSILYPICVFCFSWGTIMLINQLVTGLSASTQMQCAGAEYLRGEQRAQKLTLVEFCRDNGYYVGKHLQQEQ